MDSRLLRDEKRGKSVVYRVWMTQRGGAWERAEIEEEVDSEVPVVDSPHQGSRTRKK
jgi:hypothetical protein